MIDGDELVQFDYQDISIAVSTDRGLMVPVLRNVENLDFFGVEKEIVRLADKARNGKLSIDDMLGGTFTITNGGFWLYVINSYFKSSSVCNIGYA